MDEPFKITRYKKRQRKTWMLGWNQIHVNILGCSLPHLVRIFPVSTCNKPGNLLPQQFCKAQIARPYKRDKVRLLDLKLEYCNEDGCNWNPDTAHYGLNYEQILVSLPSRSKESNISKIILAGARSGPCKPSYWAPGL